MHREDLQADWELVHGGEVPEPACSRLDDYA